MPLFGTASEEAVSRPCDRPGHGHCKRSAASNDSKDNDLVPEYFSHSIGPSTCSLPDCCTPPIRNRQHSTVYPAYLYAIVPKPGGRRNNNPIHAGSDLQRDARRRQFVFIQPLLGALISLRADDIPETQNCALLPPSLEDSAMHDFAT